LSKICGRTAVEMNNSGPYGSDIPNSTFIGFMAACLLLNNAIREEIEHAMTITVDIVKDNLMPSCVKSGEFIVATNVKKIVHQQ
jgi:hypothetical protein